MRTLPGVGYALAGAIRKINALYLRIPESRRPDVNADRWPVLEAEIDRVCAAGDADAALLAIAEYEDFATRMLEEARR